MKVNNILNTMKKILKGFFTLIILSAVFVSCVDQDFDFPPESTLPFDPEKVYTVQDIRNIIDTTGEYLETEDYSLFALCNMDDKSGNIYKAAYISDSTGAIQIFDNGQGIYQGDSIRIYLKGVTFSSYEEQYQIQNMTVDSNVVKISVLNETPALEITIPEILSELTTFQGRLVQLQGVQFAVEDVGKPFADAVNLESLNRTLIDGDGNQIIVRTSGYASFAEELVPDGNGTVTAILGQYGEDAQLYIRSMDEIQLNDPAFFVITQSFSDGFGSWQTISITGDQEWEVSSSYGNPAPCATISGYDNGNYANEDWLISPEFDMTTFQTITLQFETAKNYTGNPLEVYASSDFDGQNIETATWDELSATLSAGNWNWVNSGPVDLSAYAGSPLTIAFRFTSTASASATWELDNIQLDAE